MESEINLPVMPAAQEKAESTSETWSGYFAKKLDKYADDAANCCACVMVLSGGLLAFVVYLLLSVMVKT